MRRVRAITTRRGIGAFAMLASGCMGYVPSYQRVEPGAEVIRVPLDGRQALMLRRDAHVDTLLGVTAAYGHVVAVRGETLTLALTQVRHGGALTRPPRGTVATVVPQRDHPVERWGRSTTYTNALLVSLTILGIATVLTLGARTN